MAKPAKTVKPPAQDSQAQNSPAQNSPAQDSPAQRPPADGRTQEEIRLGLFKKVVDFGGAWRHCENTACRRSRECIDPVPCTERYREVIMMWLREAIVPELRRMRAAGFVLGETHTPAKRAAALRALRRGPRPATKVSGAKP